MDMSVLLRYWIHLSKTEVEDRSLDVFICIAYSLILETLLLPLSFFNEGLLVEKMKNQ